MRKLLVILCALAALTSASVSTATADQAGVPAPPPPPPASSPDALAAQLQAAQAQQAALAATKASLTNEVAAAQGEQANLVALVAANQHAIQETLGNLAAAEQTFHDASAREVTERAAADAAKAQARQDRALLALYTRLRYADNNGVVDYIFSGGSVDQVLSRYQDVSHIQASSDDLVAAVQADLDRAVAAEKQAQADAQKASVAVASLAAMEDQLKKQTDTASGLISQLDSQSKAATNEITLADTQDLAVAQQIADLRIQQLDEVIAAAEQASWQAAAFYIQNHIGSLPSSITSPLPGGGSIHLTWPAPGTAISQGFGPSPLPFEPAFGGFPHFHTGLDLAGPMDTPILAPADGVVVAAITGTTGYGNHLILIHSGGIETLYGHLDQLGVHAGDSVHQGQLIGLMGSTGNSTGPHLHFEVRVNATPVDPLPLLPPLPPGADGPPKLGS